MGYSMVLTFVHLNLNDDKLSLGKSGVWINPQLFLFFNRITSDLIGILGIMGNNPIENILIKYKLWLQISLENIFYFIFDIFTIFKSNRFEVQIWTEFSNWENWCGFFFWTQATTTQNIICISLPMLMRQVKRTPQSTIDNVKTVTTSGKGKKWKYYHGLCHVKCVLCGSGCWK